MTGMNNRAVFQKVDALDETYFRKDSLKENSRNFFYCVCKAVLHILSELKTLRRKDVSVTADMSNPGLLTLFLTDIGRYFICLWSLQLTSRI